MSAETKALFKSLCEKWKFIPVRAGGKSETESGTYACEMQPCVVGIAFKNDGNQSVRIEFGGAKITLTAGQDYTHFTNFPYVNTTEYRYTFLETAVPGTVNQLLNIYVLKISDV